MAPIAVDAHQPVMANIAAIKAAAASKPAEIVDLRQYSHFHLTPVIGTEFRLPHTARDGKPTLPFREILDDQEKLRALGKLVSERGVVFFRDAIISTKEQTELVHALGLLGGKPDTSGLHINPCTAPGQKEGDEVARISNHYIFGQKFKRQHAKILQRRVGKLNWVSIK